MSAAERADVFTVEIRDVDGGMIELRLKADNRGAQFSMNAGCEVAADVVEAIIGHFCSIATHVTISAHGALGVRTRQVVGVLESRGLKVLDCE